MSYVVETMTNLAAQTGFAFLKPGNFIMILVALVFLYLAIAKGYEPLLLVPISFGMLHYGRRRIITLFLLIR